MEKIDALLNEEKEKKKKKKTLVQLFDIKCPKGYKICTCNKKKPKCKKIYKQSNLR
tara:strand:- start:814 stop:981 length:168 start_codon:yes stop_codon:yes gene_type:complete